MTKQRVLLLVNGAWQVVAGLAALKERGLTGEGCRVAAVVLDARPGSDFHRATTDLLAACVPRVHAVSKSLTPWDLAEALRFIRSALGVDLAEVDWVFAFGYHRPASRYFINGAPQAKTVIYEEGLRAYVDPSPLAERVRWSAEDLLTLLDPRFARRRVDPRFFSREVAYSLMLDDRLPLPERVGQSTRHHLSARIVKEVLAELPAPEEHPPQGQCVLIIGQYYAKLRQLDADAEVSLYVEAARAVTALGYTPVWRGHIREEDTLLSSLQRACPELRSFSEYTTGPAYPLEFHRSFFERHCVAAISLASSALFYLRYLYDTPVFTLATEPLERGMTYPHRETCAFARCHLPPIGDFIAQGVP